MSLHQDLERVAIFSTEAHPLVVVTLRGPTCSEEDLDVVFEGFRRLWVGGQRYVVLLDATAIDEAPGAGWRRKLAEWEREHAEETRQYNAGAAVVLPNPVVRACMTAVEWLFRPATPRAYFKTVPAGLEWCISRLREEGLPVTPGLRALLERFEVPTPGEEEKHDSPAP